MEGRKTGRKIRNAAVVLLVAGILVFIFGRDYQAILAEVRGISPWGLLLLLGAGMGYQLLEAAVFFTVLRGQLPSFGYGQAVTLTFLAVFGNTTTSGAGSIPLQSAYLYRRGLPVGSGIGLMMLEYILHKTSVFIYAAATMLIQGGWLRREIPSLMKYIYPGFAICGVIIAALLLLCTWTQVRRCLSWVIGRLPDREPWNRRRTEWERNLEALYDAAASLLRDRRRCLQVMLLNLCKLSWLYGIPFLCLRLLNVPGQEAGRVMALSSVMLLITGALPNVAGVGPMEFAFILLFSPGVGRVAASSALVLYRVATYFFPFLVSVGVVWRGRRD